MAQGNKSRIIIWTIVGILVVLAVVMFVTRPKNVGGKPINATGYVRAQEYQFKLLERKAAAAQSQFPNAPADVWQKIADQIAQGRTIMAEMPALTDQKDLRARRDSVDNCQAVGLQLLTSVTGKKAKGNAGGK
ncbi:MAG TPA: hypothetical protein VMH22_10365 [bacterium]|nr:hypothetical protein [bacterium]